MFESKFNVILGDDEKVLTLFGFYETLKDHDNVRYLVFETRDEQGDRQLALFDIIGDENGTAFLCRQFSLSDNRLIDVQSITAILAGVIDEFPHDGEHQSLVIIDVERKKIHSVLGLKYAEGKLHTFFGSFPLLIFSIDEGDPMPETMIPDHNVPKDEH